jgi:hypothetical protein
MKREINVLLVFLALFSLIGSVSAACTGDNVIMSLYSPGTNTHGALWSQAGYDVKICYNDIFGSSYSSTSGTSHACTARDKVISLTRATNAHASSDVSGTVPQYNTFICHEGLVNCSAVCSGITTNGDKKHIVYLSSPANAHLSNISALGYLIEICCNKNVTGGGPVTLTPTKCQNYDNITYYPDYYGATNCDNDLSNLKVAQTEMGCNSITDKTKCYCKWDSDPTKPVGQRCELNMDYTQGACNYRCVKTVTFEGACDDATGMKSATIKARVVPLPPSTTCPAQTDVCKDGPVEVPCGFISADLPFFGAWQFALSIAAVLFVYVIFNNSIKKGQYS